MSFLSRKPSELSLTVAWVQSGVALVPQTLSPTVEVPASEAPATW
jgi:hypothetical protein